MVKLIRMARTWKRKVGVSPTPHFTTEPILERELCGTFPRGADSVEGDQEVHGACISGNKVLVTPLIPELDSPLRIVLSQSDDSQLTTSVSRSTATINNLSNNQDKTYIC